MTQRNKRAGASYQGYVNQRMRASAWQWRNLCAILFHAAPVACSSAIRRMPDGGPTTQNTECRKANPLSSREWKARLAIRIAKRGQRTIVEHAHHFGPLRIQKALYPDTSGQMDLLLLHPPGGIAGGDQLSINIDVGSGAHARISTPGAAKWYRSGGHPAGQTVALNLQGGSVLEWLPQEAIIFDDADVRSETRSDCADDSRACGWDIWMLGRKRSGEHFSSGEMRQHTRLYREQTLLWSERVRLAADDPLRTSALGWNGANVHGNFWALGLPQDESLLQSCREIRRDGVHLGITRFDHGLWVARALGHSAESVRAALTEIWCQLRPALCNAPGIPPRLWST